MQKTRKTYYANGTDIGDAMIHRGIYYLNGAEATTQDWTGKPSDWSDIRKDCPANSIALYAGHKADYSQYDNLGFAATISNSGKYKVYIDGTQYGDEYNSGAQCNITWSSLALTTGDDITTPTALKAHKIWISPATSGNNITKFLFKRVAGSVQEEQGCLWVHFNLSNVIDIIHLTASSNTTWQKLLTAITAKNNVINVSNTLSMLRGCKNIEYLPILDFGNRQSGLNYIASEQTKLKTITLKNGNFTGGDSAFWLSSSLENIKAINCITNYGNNAVLNQMFLGLGKLKKLPEIFKKITANVINARAYITDATSLEEDTIIDTTEANALTRIGCYGTSSQYFMPKFKGLRVSNEAPFNNANAPQIQVDYTGMDRNALVRLFDDLPYNVGYEVVGSPTINNGVVSGFDRDSYLDTNNTFTQEIYNKFINKSETYVKIKINSLITGTSQQFFCIPLGSTYSGIYIENDNKPVFFFQSGILIKSSIAITTTGWWTFKCVIENNTATLFLSNDGSTFINSGSVDISNMTTPSSFNRKVRIGVFAGGLALFDGSVDLNNTYIKINDVYWFRGQPAMTKTLSCVGATGTADLTADDKDIALNKGWAITIS